MGGHDLEEEDAWTAAREMIKWAQEVAHRERGKLHVVRALTRRDREVIDFTRSRVKNISELTNLMI